MEKIKEREQLNEIKALEKHLDSLYDREAEIANKVLEITEKKITIHKSYPEWAELQELHKEQDRLFEEIKKKQEAYLIEYTDEVPVEILDLAFPKLKGKKCYCRISIKVDWKNRKPYGNKSKNQPNSL